MRRTPEQLAYHADKEREYRRLRQEEKRGAIVALRDAFTILQKYGYSLGAAVDLLEPLSRKENEG